MLQLMEEAEKGWLVLVFERVAGRGQDADIVAICGR
jgi:hypothetical protein